MYVRELPSSERTWNSIILFLFAVNGGGCSSYVCLHWNELFFYLFGREYHKFRNAHVQERTRTTKHVYINAFTHLMIQIARKKLSFICCLYASPSVIFTIKWKQKLFCGLRPKNGRKSCSIFFSYCPKIQTNLINW